MAKTWKDYAEAFTIFAKYGEGNYQTRAEHDEIWSGPDPEDVSPEDIARLEELGWTPADEGGFRIFT